MSDQTAVADEPKKDEKKFFPDKKDTYSENATVKQWTGTKFTNPIENVPIHRVEIKGAAAMWVWTAAGGSKAPKGSELIDKDGVTWVVESVKGGNTSMLCYVTKKPAEKP